MSINLLFAAYPAPPVANAPIGNAPDGYLDALPNPTVHRASLATFGIPLNARLTRQQVRHICRATGPTELAKYACIMAWGGQNRIHFGTSILSPDLVRLILALFASSNTRAADFGTTQAACANINGLGISFYTKLPFFMRPTPDAFILDQWTAKSSLLLSFPHRIRLSHLVPNPNGKVFAQANPDTTPEEYEAFCTSLEDVGNALWRLASPTSGEETEIAMFDRNRPDGFWRRFTKVNFNHPVAGPLLASGGQSLTTPLDYRVGLLVIQQIKPRRLFVILIHVACCHWDMEDCYCLLLARLRELKGQHGLPVTLVIQRGSCPAWFSTALADLGIEVRISDGADTPPPANDEEGPDEDGDTCAALSKSCAEASALPSSNDSGACSALPKELPVPQGEKKSDKITIWLSDRNSQNGERHRRAIRILTENDYEVDNDGAICLRHGFLDLKLNGHSPRFLIDDIANYNFAGAPNVVNFTSDPRHVPANNNKTNCWAGVGYEGYLAFKGGNNPIGTHAVAYLKDFFHVRACHGNHLLTQAWIDAQ